MWLGIFNGSNDQDFYRLVGIRIGLEVLLGFKVVISGGEKIKF